ncbi:DUF6194 family protein [Amycolatopsis viridis]|uniref:DUF6194 domain-containing protein n=1 Tax=Amycolatopsis viridis TaxID=185678 RepID=A0ABX0SQS2_9PSEU|nr:DUF6194 family protein [Amycolatopsis viridis]NIH78014.1 hypothetical protein [Amycolatopsis viridis]
MDLEHIRQELAAFSGTRLAEASGTVFALYDPNGDLPPQRQLPWATIVTADTEFDNASDLDRPGVFRLNIGLTRARFGEVVPPGDYDVTALDVLFPHPVYAGQHWVCVINPDRTWPAARKLLDEAYEFAVRKFDNAERRRR